MTEFIQILTATVGSLGFGILFNVRGKRLLAVAVGGRADSFSGLVRMNGTGAFLWNLMVEQDITREELLDKLLATYEVSKDVALADIIAFETKLRDGGILE